MMNNKTVEVIKVTINPTINKNSNISDIALLENTLNTMLTPYELEYLHTNWLAFCAEPTVYSNVASLVLADLEEYRRNKALEDIKRAEQIARETARFLDRLDNNRNYTSDYHRRGGAKYHGNADKEFVSQWYKLVDEFADNFFCD